MKNIADTGKWPEARPIVLAAMQTYLETTSDMMFVKDVNSVYTAASDAFVRMTGKESAADIIGHTDFEIFDHQPELATNYTTDDRKLFASDTNLINYVEPLTDDNGQPRYSITSKYILRDENGRQIGLFGISRDITNEYLSRRHHEDVLKYLFELPEDIYAACFMDIDDWAILRHQSHPVLAQEIEVCETMEGFAESALNSLADPDDKEAHAFYQTLSRESMLAICTRGMRDFSLEYLRTMSDGEPRWTRTEITFMVDPDTGHHCAIWLLRDIDAEKRKLMHLLHAAEHDEMTGLLNRAFTIRYINQVLEDHGGEQHSLIIIDVDNFKTLNDTLGHQTGDMFLVALSRSLKKCFRESDIVGRIGGDEFFILMKNIPSPVAAREKAETVLNISQMICSSYPGMDLSISLGISLFPGDGKTLDELYAAADKALYRAKGHGKNRFVFAADQ